MTVFSALSPELKLAIACGMFITCFFQLLVCIYKFKNKADKKSLIADSALLAALMVFSALLTAAAYPANPIRYNISVPFIVIVALESAVLLGSVIRLINERRRSADRLSPDSIRQALDNLNSGVFFSDANSKTVLINHTMLRLSNELTGGYPQLLEDFRKALDAPEKYGSAVMLNASPAVYRFPDSSIWRFRTVELSCKGLEGFSQTTAQEITDIYNANEKLKKENETLRSTNLQLQQMYNRLADRIRDEETLKLKTKIHDNIGTSLIAITDILNGNGSEDMELQLKTLNDAISYFSNDVPERAQTLEEAVAKAAEMKVDLEIHGEIPEDESLRSVIVSAARESVTNCINHAHGDRVVIDCKLKDNSYLVKVTNNGDAPTKPIREGSGLSALRKRTESVAGTMELAYKPEFSLLIKLPYKES